MGGPPNLRTYPPWRAYTFHAFDLFVIFCAKQDRPPSCLARRPQLDFCSRGMCILLNCWADIKSPRAFYLAFGQFQGQSTINNQQLSTSTKLQMKTASPPRPQSTINHQPDQPQFASMLDIISNIRSI